MITDKQKARQRTQMLKRLRAEHGETIERTQAHLKAQKCFRRDMCKAIRTAPKTVPEIAEETGLPADQVLWHITAMKKYGLVEEVGICGCYYQYTIAQEEKS